MERPKSNLELPIDTLNKFLKKNTFQVKKLRGVFSDYEMDLNIKVQITGVKSYIRVGEWTDYIEYEIFILPTEHKKTNEIINLIFPSDEWTKITTTENPYYRLTIKVDDLLENFISFFGVNAPVMPIGVKRTDKNILDESFLFESRRLDSVVRKVVSDIIKIIKTKGEGNYELPEDISENDMTYSFPQLNSNFTVELNISESDEVSKFKIDANFYREEDVIEVNIILNLNTGQKIFQDLIKRLNETLMHELSHMKQHEKGYSFPDEEPNEPLDYYLQQHELDAQLKGFDRRARKEKTPIEDVIDEWFLENQEIHQLTTQEIQIIKNKLLELYKQKKSLGKSF